MVELKSRIIFLIYKTLLLDLGVQKTKEVFEKKPLLLNNRVIPPVDLYSMIFADKLPAIPFDYVCSLYMEVERVLRAEGITRRQFMENLLNRRSRAYLISSSKDVLQAIEPFLTDLFSGRDPRYFVLAMANVIHTIHVPQSHMNVVAEAENAEIATAILEIMYSETDYHKYAYNPDLWKAFIIKESPRSVGAPPFDTVSVLADCRTLDDIPELGEYTIDGSAILYEGSHIGRIVTYGEFLHSHNIELTRVRANHDILGIEVTMDVEISNNDFPLLRKNCFYGAPSYLLEVTFQIANNFNPRALKEIVGTLTTAVESPSETFLNRHNEIIQSFSSQKYDIVYHADTRKLFMNGRKFATNLPAVLFYYLLKMRKDSGCTLFNYQEIAVAPLLEKLVDPIKPNIDVRISRLQKRLNQDAPLFEISRAGHGSIHFDAHIDYELTIKQSE